MTHPLAQTYGPLVDHLGDVSDFLWYSEQAFQAVDDVRLDTHERTGTPADVVLRGLLFHAVNASYSVRLLTTWAQPTEGFALLRTRLEQTIVFSYLLHADPERGLLPYAQDVERTGHRTFQGLAADAELHGFMTTLFAEKAEHAARAAEDNEQRIDPDFDLAKDVLKRKWTPLSLYDMALHRDRLAADSVIKISLRSLYLGLYKPACIVVHSEPGVLTDNFLVLNEMPDGSKQFGPPLASVLVNLLNLAVLDLVQTYEFLRWTGSPAQERLADLYVQLQTVVESEILPGLVASADAHRQT